MGDWRRPAWRNNARRNNPRLISGTVVAQPEHRGIELDGKSIARGDKAFRVELKNAWPDARERPEERLREPRL